jgi:putative ABC transport system permease protein
MATSLAWRNLAHSKVRTLVALAGVCFAVTLLFMQLGFFAAVSLTAVLVYDALDLDIVLTSPSYVMISQAGTFPRVRLAQARAHPEVKAAMPLYVDRQLWRNPISRSYRSLVIMAFNPEDSVSRDPELERLRPRLARPDTVILDRLSRPDLGPQDTGVVTEVGPRNLTIVGQCTIGPGFEAGLIIVSAETFARLFENWPLSDVSIGLVKLAPGTDADRVAQELRASLPTDVNVLLRRQIEAKEQHYWVVNTSTGIIFGSGVLVALLFGVVIIYQVLSMEVSSRLSEYATLKAMGFSDNYLSFVVVQQALIFAVCSYLPAFFIAIGIYRMSHELTKLPIGMTAARAIGVFVVTLVMCTISGWLAMRILRKADPVEHLF